MALLFRKPASKQLWMRKTFGWNRQIIDNNGRDIWAEQITLPRGGKSHHRTDLIVEWNRLNAQRGAKLMCALIPFSFIVGLLMGVVVTWLV